MSASMSHSASAEPNLTPILDMVFQLITFFMLVINFKGAAMDLTLKLPIVGSARPIDTKGQDDLLILNIDSLGRLNVYGQYKQGKDIDSYIRGEAYVSRLHARRGNPKLEDGDELPTNIVIRADKAVPFSLLNKIIKVCQDRGFRRFSLKAMNKQE